MAQLAIRGHVTRGNEVIEILEMLGDNNQNNVYSGKDTFHYYFIDNETGYIKTKLYTDDCWTKLTYNIFTLEEFLEKFPYKVGDKVLLKGVVKTIKQACWDNTENEVIYKLETNVRGFSEEYYVHHYDLQPYKEETMEEIKMDIPKGYEFAGVDDDKQQVVFTKIQPQYPKTYEECCKVVNASPYVELVYNVSDGQKYSYDIDNLQIYENIRRLKICRDAYWKIAGEQMGLGKPWEPDWSDESERKYTIVVHDNQHCYANCKGACGFLTFPTAELRDAFYENFKDLIEQCKEIL